MKREEEESESWMEVEDHDQVQVEERRGFLCGSDEPVQ